MRHKTLPLLVVFVAVTCMTESPGAGGKISLQHTVIPVRTGQAYVPSLRLFRTPLAGRVQSISVNKAAVFPFADYTHQQSFIRPLEWGANRTIVESLTDHFLSHGIAVVLQEDVEGVLIADGLIRPPTSNYAGVAGPMDRFRERAMIASTPEFELFWGLHDEVMRPEIMAVVRTAGYWQPEAATMPTPGEPLIQGMTGALPRDKLVELGSRLDVDLIIRGRILEYGVKIDRPNALVVQLRVYAQDARTGELFWSNRAAVEVQDRSASGWSPPNLKSLFDYATREVVQALMADFFGER